MSLNLIRAILFCCAIVVIALSISIGGIAGDAIAAIAGCALPLFVWGCRISARQEKKRILTRFAGSIAPSPAPLDNLQSEPPKQDRPKAQRSAGESRGA